MNFKFINAWKEMGLGNKKIAMHEKTRGWKAYVTDRGWVGGFQNGDNSHLCANYFS